MAILLTTSSVARRCGRSESTIRTWARIGRLRATRTETGLQLFDPLDVDRLVAELAQRRQGSAGPQ